MATKPLVTQLRYYGIGNEKNIPLGEADGYWINGINTETKKMKNLLQDLGSAIKIGIQTLPGTVFYLSDTNRIIIDHTGIYELDLTDTTTTINTLFFDPKSLAMISQIDNASLIVDILYYPDSDKGGENI